ncbi:MAG: L-2-amino-thiazoline-4-carboxylic acid hydrolase [Deltaproteobacteria bacterium]|nr:L-2-amino-thiazoline-4-carboxylic acid hydrolase [Candidatus Zymogenaceae bacterium]
MLKEAIERFGFKRGRRIAENVKGLGLPLTFKNRRICSDLDSSKNLQPIPDIQDDDLVVKVSHCTFYNAEKTWGLGEYAHIYCKYVDYKILEGYSQDVKMELFQRQTTGEDFCLFRYRMKE